MILENKLDNIYVYVIVCKKKDCIVYRCVYVL